MAFVWFDSSAFTKLLLQEEGSVLAARVWRECHLPVASRLAYVEVRASLHAAHRDRRLSADELGAALPRWDELWAEVAVVELAEAVAGDAGQLAGRYALRGADAVHLASALTFGETLALMVCWDERLAAAAIAAGLQVVPERPPG